jgi:enoyl-CoA hydratase/carnithine racemase
MSSFLEIASHGRVLEITLQRPDRRNALNREMCQAIVDACRAADQDPHIGAIYWKAQGPIFSSGMDLEEAASPNVIEDTAIHGELFSLGRTLSKPIVCAVQGPALAGGLGLVANAHVAIAVHGTTFGLTEIRIGMWPYAIYDAVAQALGARRALELTLTSKIFNTPEALSWGLIQEVVPSFELEERGEAIAHALANSSTESIQRGLRFVASSRNLNPDSAMKLALDLRAEHFQSLDFEEGLKAFREKRPPRWPSHP